MTTLRAHDEAQHKVIQQKLDDAFKALTGALKARGIPFEVAHSGLTHRRSLSAGKDTYVPVEIRAERGSGHYAAPKKIRVQVGGYGNKTQFPERKKGFDFEAVVAAIEGRITEAKTDRLREKAQGKRRGDLEEAVSRIREKAGDIEGVRCHADQYLSGIDIEIGRLTEEKALAVMQALKGIL